MKFLETIGTKKTEIRARLDVAGLPGLEDGRFASAGRGVLRMMTGANRLMPARQEPTLTEKTLDALEASMERHPIRNPVLGALALAGALAITGGHPIQEIARDVAPNIAEVKCTVATGNPCMLSGRDLFDMLEDGGIGHPIEWNIVHPTPIA